MIISVSGKIGSGKDTVGLMVQFLTSPNGFGGIGGKDEHIEEFIEKYEGETNLACEWEVKKWADKLKDIVCVLIGCTREQLENREFKEAPLGEEWNKWKVVHDGLMPYSEIMYTAYYNSEAEALEHQDDYDTDPELIETTPRLMLQLLGTNCGRDIIHPNIWVNSLMADYKKRLPTTGGQPDFDWNVLPKDSDYIYPNWLITDTRFPNEADAVLEKKGILIRVNRYPKTLTKCKGPNDCKEIPFDKDNPKHWDLYKGECLNQHASENSLDNYEKFTYIIDNNGSLKDLYFKVKEILIKENIIKHGR